MQPRKEIFDDIAQKLHQVLGHGFFAHDLLIDGETGAIFVCEGGFKFNDGTYTAHLDIISDKLPSHQILFPTRKFAEFSADIFVKQCQAILDKR